MGRAEGEAHSHVGVPYLTDEETEALRAELNAVFWQTSQSFFLWGFLPSRGRGAHSIQSWARSSAASTLKSCRLLNVSRAMWNNTHDFEGMVGPL